MSSDVDDQDTEPRFPRGTQAGSLGTGDRAALDLAELASASLVFDASGRIVDVNSLAEALVGYTRRELVGEPVGLIAAQLEGLAQLDRIRLLPENTGASVRHRSGRAIPVEILLHPQVGGPTVAIVRAIEITAAGLRQDDVAQIVHDLKNPLSTIALELYQLDGEPAHGHPPKTREALARITRNVEFIDRMVHDLLDLCSAEAGRLELRRRPTELRALLEQIIDRVVPTRDRLRVSLRAAEPMTISIDDLRIERVVANLLQNALTYAPRVTGIIVGLAAVNDAIRVSVTDAGPGMTATEAGTVFDKFRRGSTAGSHEGSGLGLYVSKKIVEAHGGRIDVTSVRGVGSQFFFELPAT
jgi:PAS domain S-box-containing protein